MRRDQQILAGWRARLGFLIPPGNTTVEPEMFELAPAGVSVHFARLIARGSLVPRRPTAAYSGPLAPAPAAAAQADPDWEFSLALLAAGLKSLNSMAGELEAGDTSADVNHTSI